MGTQLAWMAVQSFLFARCDGLPFAPGPACWPMSLTCFKHQAHRADQCLSIQKQQVHSEQGGNLKSLKGDLDASVKLTHFATLCFCFLQIKDSYMAVAGVPEHDKVETH